MLRLGHVIPVSGAVPERDTNKSERRNGAWPHRKLGHGHTSSLEGMGCWVS